MEFLVGGPHVHADPAGAVFAAGAKPGPVKKLAAEPLTGELPADGNAPDIDSRLMPVGFRPDPVVVRAGGQRGGWPELPGQDEPSPPRPDRPFDVPCAPVLIPPARRPPSGIPGPA